MSPSAASSRDPQHGRHLALAPAQHSHLSLLSPAECHRSSSTRPRTGQRQHAEVCAAHHAVPVAVGRLRRQVRPQRLRGALGVGGALSEAQVGEAGGNGGVGSARLTPDVPGEQERTADGATSAPVTADVRGAVGDGRAQAGQAVAVGPETRGSSSSSRSQHHHHQQQQHQLRPAAGPRHAAAASGALGRLVRPERGRYDRRWRGNPRLESPVRRHGHSCSRLGRLGTPGGRETCGDDFFHVP